MEVEKILKALRSLKVETGSLACLGCGHENSCSTKGCAILRQAEEELKRQSVELEAMRTAVTSLKMHLEAGSKIDIEKSAKNILDRVQQKLGISAEQLMDLVQAYQDGRCVVLPCKVGDKLYKISKNSVKEAVAQSAVFMLSHTVNHLMVHVANERGAMIEVEMKDFGKTVFLDRESAEAALKGEQQ